MFMRISLPEQIWIDYESATFASRLLAFAIDFFVRWISALALFLVLSLFIYATSSFNIVNWVSGDNVSAFFIAFMIFFIFIMEWGYPVYFDIYKQGVSPGKYMVGLRVVDERGLPIAFRASCLRTILRAIDILPFFGAIAFLSMQSTRKSQRLGDIVAGTMVIHESENVSYSLSEMYLNTSTNEAVICVPRQLHSAIQKYFERSSQLTSVARAAALNKLAEVVYATCPSEFVSEQSVFKTQDEWLEHIFHKMRPMKESKALLDSDKHAKWRDISKELLDIHNIFLELTSLEAKGGKNVPKEFLSKVAQAYQLVCQRYAYLATFYPDSAEAFTAARLVRVGRRVVYGNRLSVLDKEEESVLYRIPKSFAHMKWHCFFAVAIMLLGGIGTASLVYLNPSLSHNFISEQMRADLSQGIIWTDQVQGNSVVSASAIMTNNIGVTFLAFALGITGGIGTAIVLIVNGALLGGMFVALQKYDMSFRLFEFVIAHGVLELSVIAVAGGTGLYLGEAILRPGSLTRRRAIQNRGRVIVDLIILNAVCLVVAGAVEGFVSPYPHYTLALKVFIGVSLGVLYWGYLLYRPQK